MLVVWSGIALVGFLARVAFALELGLIAFGVALAVLGFVLGEVGREGLAQRGFRRSALVFHPVLVSACFTGVLWRAAQQPLAHYLHHGSQLVFDAPGNWLMVLLAPSVVCLGLILDQERELLRANVRPLLAGTMIGALFSMFVSATLSRVLELSPIYARALLPKAVTTPVALVIADIFGGDAGLTAVFVVVSGLLGALFAAPILRRFGFVTPVVQGVATGVSSHGIGTAALLRDNPRAAAFSAISFALTAAASVGFASVEAIRVALTKVLGD